MSQSAPSVCLVTPEFPGLNLCADLGAYTQTRAGRLAEGGCQAHVLLCARADARTAAVAEELAARGIGFSTLADVAYPAHLNLPGPNQYPFLYLADKVRCALEPLHAKHCFDLIEFPERGALGFRTIQAKRTGVAFQHVPLIVTAHGPSQWQRQQNQQWLDQPQQLALDYCERYAFEHADVGQLASPVVEAALHKLGWARKDEGGRRQDSSFILHPSSFPWVTVCVPYFNLGDFLEETLASLAAQTYGNLEVLVIDDGSTAEQARQRFQEMEKRHPHYRFFTQDNQGIGATRNRGLELARGKYFLPLDADNLAQPELVQRLAAGMERNPELAALSCYFLAFGQSADLALGRFCYSYRPTGGPRVLGSLKNVYGDGTALFRSDALRAVGGFETERDSSWEDWEVFVKLVNAGFQVDVMPEVLFYYRHREAGFSRVTEAHRNQQRVLRQYVALEGLPYTERLALWNYLAGLQRRVEELEDQNHSLRRRLASLRYRFADKVQRWVERIFGKG